MANKFFRDRYGLDVLSFVLLFISLILSKARYIWIIALILFVVAIFRTLSKDISNRKKEQQKFEKFYNPIIRSFVLYKTKLQQRKYFVHFKCEKCKNNLRLPKNKGKLQGKCPVCGLEFIRRT